jgi:phenylalanyl-tRNA synthetase alpha chain
MADLKFALEGMVRALFGAATQSKWVDAYFPFTDPSAEMEIFFEDKWLEVLGCGKIRQQILANCALPADTHGWAFGMGLERLAMVMYDIPDIRLFWSEDARFLDQFASGRPVKFKPYSKFPPCYKDVTFWIPESFHENDFFVVIREIAGDMVESVRLLDEFTHPKTGRTSRCYRINYRNMDRNLTNAEVDAWQADVRAALVSQLGAALR